MFKRQAGVTFIGWLILLIPIALLGYVGIRLVPIYLNYQRVSHSIDETARELKGDDSTSVGSIRNSLEKHFDIESIDFPSAKDVAITRDGASWVIEAKFQDTAPLFYNVSLLVDFDKIARAGG